MKPSALWCANTKAQWRRIKPPGLAAGETVIVDGLDRLRDGSTVSVATSVDTPKADDVHVLPAQQRESTSS